MIGSIEIENGDVQHTIVLKGNLDAVAQEYIAEFSKGNFDKVEEVDNIAEINNDLNKEADATEFKKRYKQLKESPTILSVAVLKKMEMSSVFYIPNSKRNN